MDMRKWIQFTPSGSRCLDIIGFLKSDESKSFIKKLKRDRKLLIEDKDNG